jgi:hypothetical protein
MTGWILSIQAEAQGLTSFFVAGLPELKVRRVFKYHRSDTPRSCRNIDLPGLIMMLKRYAQGNSG